MSDPARPDMRRLALASVAGTALEYYDFAVYNTLAALVFNQLFCRSVAQHGEPKPVDGLW